MFLQKQCLCYFKSLGILFVLCWGRYQRWFPNYCFLKFCICAPSGELEITWQTWLGKQIEHKFTFCECICTAGLVINAWNVQSESDLDACSDKAAYYRFFYPVHFFLQKKKNKSNSHARIQTPERDRFRQNIC